MNKRNTIVAIAASFLVCGLGIQNISPEGWLADFLAGLLIGGSIVMNGIVIVNYRGSGKLRQLKKNTLKIGS